MPRTLGLFCTTEVAAVKKNQDGTITLTVKCSDMVLCDDALITHDLTVKPSKKMEVFNIGE